jgi:hypothetical protein
MGVFKSDWIVLIALVVGLVGPNWQPLARMALGIEQATPAPTVPEPSAELQAVVAPLAAMVTGSNATTDRAELSAFCTALAEFHSRDKAALVKATQLLADHNAAALQGFYQNAGMTGRYPGLGAAIDKALGERLGLLTPDGKFKAGVFDAAMAAKAADFYSALAWAFAQPISKG